MVIELYQNAHTFILLNYPSIAVELVFALTEVIK